VFYQGEWYNALKSYEKTGDRRRLSRESSRATLAAAEAVVSGEVEHGWLSNGDIDRSRVGVGVKPEGHNTWKTGFRTWNAEAR